MSESRTQERRALMGLMAKAPPERLAALIAALGPEPASTWARPPETGTVMLQGRIGGTGAAFNLGEMTMTRCVVQLDGGAIGFAHVQGRDKAHARRAAIVDALWQADPDRIEKVVLAPLRAEAEAVRLNVAAKAAATRVDFFTLVRGEDS